MTRILVLIGFVIAFGAGWMASGTWHPPHPGGPGEQPPKGNRGSWLVQQLELTPDQQKQMDQIWSELGGRGGHREDPAKRGELRKERDLAILALIRPEDRAAYDRVMKEYNEKNEAIDQEWKKAFQRAVERTREMLTPQQREKYDKLMSRQGWDGGPRDRGRPPTRPTSNP
jgi:Spy/CpxP family protein refolding chaperone